MVRRASPPAGAADHGKRVPEMKMYGGFATCPGSNWFVDGFRGMAACGLTARLASLLVAQNQRLRCDAKHLNQIREEVYFTKGRVIVRGQLSTRGEPKRADYVLYHKPGIPLAVLEAKDNNHTVGQGMQQALDYASTLDVPFAFSSNGDAFLFHDRTGKSQPVERELTLEEFPSAEDLWRRYCQWRGIIPMQTAVVAQDYCVQGPEKEPRYYQEIAINRAIEAIAKGQTRVLLTMATGTGKTFVAFQIIRR